MRKSRPLYLVLTGIVLVVMLTLMTSPQHQNVFAQGVTPAAETVVPPPAETPVTPTATDIPTDTPMPDETATDTPMPDETPTPTSTLSAPETVAPGVTSTPDVPISPVPIPEPITVVLFGTGLAALSAAAASRRKNNGNGDSE